MKHLPSLSAVNQLSASAQKKTAPHSLLCSTEHGGGVSGRRPHKPPSEDGGRHVPPKRSALAQARSCPLQADQASTCQGWSSAERECEGTAGRVATRASARLLLPRHSTPQMHAPQLR